MHMQVTPYTLECVSWSKDTEPPHDDKTWTVEKPWEFQRWEFQRLEWCQWFYGTVGEMPSCRIVRPMQDIDSLKTEKVEAVASKKMWVCWKTEHQGKAWTPEMYIHEPYKSKRNHLADDLNEELSEDFLQQLEDVLEKTLGDLAQKDALEKLRMPNWGTKYCESRLAFLIEQRNRNWPKERDHTLRWHEDYYEEPPFTVSYQVWIAPELAELAKKIAAFICKIDPSRNFFVAVKEQSDEDCPTLKLSRTFNSKHEYSTFLTNKLNNNHKLKVALDILELLTNKFTRQYWKG